jgi:hypothetical protein
MRLRLAYEPTPENAPKFAADIVAAAENVDGVKLDYSVASLAKVDNILESLRRDGTKANQVGETLFAFGCYVGEVFVRQNGCRWETAERAATPHFGPFGLVIDLGETKFCDPIGKAFKRLDNGEVDSLAYFYTVFSPKTNVD